MKKCAVILIFSFFCLITDAKAQKQQYSFMVGGGSAETFHMGGAYHLYPSGRLSISLGLIRDFNQWVLFPWYGSYSKVHFTSFSLDHQYFFKTGSGKVTPFYLRTGLTYREDQHFSYNGSSNSFNEGNAYQFLFLNLTLGISVDLPRHWGFSLDFGAAPLWREGFISDVDNDRLLITPLARAQIYYWK